MGTSDKYQLIYCTCPDKESGKRIASALIQARLAACVNMLPNITSIYEWQGNIEESDEYLLLIKSTQQHYATLEKTILDLHPYELPEIIAVSIHTGLPAYLAWVDENTTDV